MNEFLDDNSKPIDPPIEELLRQAVQDLANLDPAPYELKRVDTAKHFNIRATALDDMVKAERQNREGSPEKPDNPFSLPEPWQEAVDGVELVKSLEGAFRRFCIMPEASYLLCAFWVLHAWAHDTASYSPILFLTSPEKACGKTTVLNVVTALSPKALPAANMTAAVVFRVVDIHKPTLLIDEADTFLNEDSELTGILNSGHHPGGCSWRTVGDDHEPKAFSTWSPKAIAMIGKPMGTLESRCLIVPLRRKAEHEKVERWRHKNLNSFLDLKRQCLRWVQDHRHRLENTEIEFPESIMNRDIDNVEHIRVIAYLIGGGLLERLDSAIVESFAGNDESESRSKGEILLHDIREIFEASNARYFGAQELTEKLCALEDSPWGEWRRGSPITSRGVAHILKPYGIKSEHSRIGRSYQRDDFEDAFNRYLKPDSVTLEQGSVTLSNSSSVTEKYNNNNDIIGGVTDVTLVTDNRDTLGEGAFIEEFEEGEI